MITKDTLTSFYLFKGIPDDIVEEIAKLCEEKTYKEGEYIFREGERADKLHLLIHGGVALRVNLTSRPDFVTVSIVNQPYQTLGWSGVVPPNHYTASAYCEEDSELIILPAVQFMKILEAHPEAGFKIMLHINEIIADRLRNSRQALLKTL